MAFWAFKSQNFEKSYKIKIKNHANLLQLIQFFLILLQLLVVTIHSLKTVGKTEALPKKLSESLKPLKKVSEALQPSKLSEFLKPLCRKN